MATTSPRIGSLIGRLLKLTQPDGVDAHQRQNRQTERYECDVEHERLLAGAVLSAEPRKLSIANRAPARKDFISFASGCGCARRSFARGRRRRSDPGHANGRERAAFAGAEMCRVVAAAVNISYRLYNGRSTHSALLTPGKMW